LIAGERALLGEAGTGRAVALDDQRGGERGDEQQQRQGGGGEWMTPCRQPDVAEQPAPRGHRPPVEPAVEIGGERRGVGIALARRGGAGAAGDRCQLAIGDPHRFRPRRIAATGDPLQQDAEREDLGGDAGCLPRDPFWSGIMGGVRVARLDLAIDHPGDPEVEHTGIERHRRVIVVRGHQHDMRHGPTASGERLDQVEAIQLRHLDIEEQDVDAARSQWLDRVTPAARTRHDLDCRNPCKQPAHPLDRQRLVVDHHCPERHDATPAAANVIIVVIPVIAQ